MKIVKQVTLIIYFSFIGFLIGGAYESHSKHLIFMKCSQKILEELGKSPANFEKVHKFYHLPEIYALSYNHFDAYNAVKIRDCERENERD